MRCSNIFLVPNGYTQYRLIYSFAVNQDEYLREHDFFAYRGGGDKLVSVEMLMKFRSVVYFKN